MITANLIASPGCEASEPATWYQASGNKWGCCDTDTSCGAPRTGSFLFFPGDDSGPDGSSNNPYLQELYTEVNVTSLAGDIDSVAGLKFLFGAYLRTHCGMDGAQAVVEYRSAAGAVLDSYVSCRYRGTSWGHAADLRVAPSGTRIVRVRAIAQAKSGTAADGYFDDFSLQACAGASCGTTPTVLTCPTTVTQVATSDIIKDLEVDCERVLSVGTALGGIGVLTAIRVGACTETCAVTWKKFKAAVDGAQAVDCADYNAISGFVDSQYAVVDSKCRRPVPDVQTVPDYSAAAPQAATTQRAMRVAATLLAAVAVVHAAA